MKCPICGHPDHRVLRTDAKDGTVRRTRECLQCAHRWLTLEAPAEVYDRAAKIRAWFREMERRLATMTRKTETVLYRHFAADGVLLYVGISQNERTRRLNHARVAPWFCNVIRTDLERFASRSAALAAERAAIRNEHPVYNVVGKRA